MTYSCVSDETIVSNQNLVATNTQSASLMAILNRVSNSSSSSDSDPLPCFDFVYPITLGFNTSATVIIQNDEALLDVIESQTSNLYIDSVQFPIQVTFENTNTTMTLNNETDLIDLLLECEYDTIRTIFDSTYGVCFDFIYPVSMLDNAGNHTTINSSSELSQFIDSQGQNYQPNFVFPIRVLDSTLQQSYILHSYFDFFYIINDCNRCPSTSDFIVEVTNPHSLVFRIKPINIPPDVDRIFFTYPDGSIMPYERTNGEWLPFTISSSGPVQFQLCQSYTHPNCPNETHQNCNTIVAEELCADLDFSVEQLSGTTDYVFTANFEDRDLIDYNWVINDSVVGNSDNFPNHTFPVTLSPGTVVEACIKYTSEACLEGVSVCKTIEVPYICPEVDFSYMNNGDNSYTFSANFDAMNSIVYGWYVDGNLIETDGAGGDNQLTFQFSQGGIHNVCIITSESHSCPNGTSFCKTITI